MGRQRLGELLLDAGIINEEQLNVALTLQGERCRLEKIGRILTSLGFVKEDTIIEFLSRQYGTPGINLNKEEINKTAVRKISRDVAEKHKAIPIGFHTDQNNVKLRVAMANPMDLVAIDTIAFITGYDIEPVFAREEDLKWAIRYNYNHERKIRLAS